MPTALAQTFEPDSTTFVAPPLRNRPTRRIRDDAEALAVAREIAAELASGAARRGAARPRPHPAL